MRWIALLLGAALAATYVSPAMGGPDLAGRVARIDKRERAHYRDLERRVRATALLAGQDPVLRTTVVTAPVTQTGRFYAATARCGYGQTLTGGGVDWGSSLVAQSWHVISSAPTTGEAWTASLAATDSLEGPTDVPKVYAVCAVVR